MFKQMKEPLFFDNQSQAAAILKIDVEELRQAKRDGCPAFRSGRIYRAELDEWFTARKAKPSASKVGAETRGQAVLDCGWDNRQSALFEIMELVHEAYGEGKIDIAQYQAIGDETAQLVLKIGEAWGAGIDAQGYYANWQAVIARGAIRLDEKNKGERVPSKNAVS